MSLTLNLTVIDLNLYLKVEKKMEITKHTIRHKSKLAKKRNITSFSL